jgi:hypothetical protein
LAGESGRGLHFILQKLMEANLNYIDELSGDDLDFYTNIFIIKRELADEIEIYNA